jgi:molecular chaperone GrpE (heat shock protein)
MFDFDSELKKLKSGIPQELIKPFTINSSDEKLSELSSKIENLSLQTEEIYEIIENNSADNILIKTFVSVCDLLEAYFTAYDTDGAGKRKFREILNESGISLLGEAGERLSPEIHRVIGAEETQGMMPEQILQVVQSGYSYKNKVIRKAKVVVSK